ncbi:MAG: carboxypeptidase-like regulatory domain-containing protein [Acidobacteriia bacterium]|nr:carboxypeptidase-like regulatory domain-containing protein [Terriglobia bacterium]
MSGAVFRAETDASGRYRLERLPEGRYSLWVRAPGHDSVWIRQVVVEQGQTVHQDVHLGKSQSGGFPPQSGAGA